MASQDRARKAYKFLRERYSSNTPFTVDDVIAATGWKRTTVETYITKQWRDLVDRQGSGRIAVRPEINRLSEEAFLRIATQNRRIFTLYDRIKYREVVTYEFLLPLTREDQLRKALDALFYDDTVRQRLSEIGAAQLDKGFKRKSGESEAAYFNRICKFISAKFGGYSISHVSGRYRATTLASREDAGKMLVADERYIIDETTASVRFVIPVEATKVTDQQVIDQIDVSASGLESDVAEEVGAVHWLFFNLFVEAVVRMVEGEDEIWLVEEAGRQRSLYVWERA